MLATEALRAVPVPPSPRSTNVVPYLAVHAEGLRASHQLACDGPRPSDGEPEDADWRRAHLELTRLARSKGAYDADEARWLRAAHATRVHARLGYATFAEYLERTFGYGPRVAQERLRVAEALAKLPLLHAKLERAELTWSAVRELTRVAVPETEAEWAAHADGRSVRDIERDVAGRLPGDRPDASERRAPATRRLVLDVSPETFATFREAVGQLRRQTETPLSDEDALLEMSRRVLGGPTDEGEASYQIALSVCPSCGHGAQLGRGEPVPVDPVVVEQADCDARTFVSPPAPPSDRPRAQVSTEAPSTRSPANEPAGASARASARAHVGAGAGASARAHVGASAGASSPRATQTIPPSTRRRVWARDHGRCVVPGCRCSTYVDLHHLRLRSEGGTHDDDNLVVLCGAHHRAVHRGTLRITGTPARGLDFAHADGTPYGVPVDPASLDALRDMTLGLKALGFTSREADAAGRAAVAHVGASAPWDALMRAALAAARAGPAGLASSGASGPGAPYGGAPHGGARPS